MVAADSSSPLMLTTTAPSGWVSASASQVSFLGLNFMKLNFSMAENSMLSALSITSLSGNAMTVGSPSFPALCQEDR